jgi:putative ABC transport system permease protein
MGMDQDDIIIAPFSTVQKRMLSTTNIQTIMVSAKSHELIDKASDEITQLLETRHKIGRGEEDDFTIRTQSDLESMFTGTSKVLTILLASIASISLIVGGIGIMNIMFVSVTERTREIGIRMAVGAKSKDVLMQFLIESILLSFIGGLIGIFIGLLISNFVSSMMGWPVTISLNSILISFFSSAATGIFFGWYPARKAANLNPIEALRFE